MKVAVLTPTKRYGGLDVVLAGLKLQTRKPDEWIVCDDLWNERLDVFDAHVYDDADVDISAHHIPPPEKPEGYYSNLTGIYNHMVKHARRLGCDYAISLQDYIYIRPDGIERFVKIAEEVPGALLTGLCSMAATPTAEDVLDPTGLWTIFQEPYTPQAYEGVIEWMDVRLEDGIVEPHDVWPQWWEMNWAAFPLDLPDFDEEYGKHIGCENHGYAMVAARDHGRRIILDPKNHSLSLPHRYYFPQEWAEQQPHREANQERYG